MRRSAVPCAATLLAAVLFAPSAVAQGFSVYEHDACAMARGGAGVAAPCNSASAVFFNPAGILSGGKPWNIEAGVTPIAPTGSFTDSATRTQTKLNNRVFPVPFGYVTRQLGRRVAVGVGVFAPYGLTTDWPTSSPGRFMAYKTSIATFYVQPTVAVELAPGLQLGAGVDYVHSSAQVHRHIDASQVGERVSGQTIYLSMLGVPVGTDFADAFFDVSGSGWAGHAGLLWKATDRISLGVRYLSQVKVNFTGTATFKPVATGITLPAGNPFGVPGGTTLDQVLSVGFLPDSALSNRNASTSVTMPWQVVAGVALRITRDLTVMGDWQHTNWSAFNSLNLKLLAPDTTISEYENYGNTDGFRVGFDWQARSGIAVRGGFLTHNGASPAENVTPILPEGRRYEGTIGLGIPVTPALHLDVAYQYIKQLDRHGRVLDPPPGVTPTPLLNTGLFNFTANLFSASVALAF